MDEYFLLFLHFCCCCPSKWPGVESNTHFVLPGIGLWYARDQILCYGTRDSRCLCSLWCRTHEWTRGFCSQLDAITLSYCQAQCNEFLRLWATTDLYVDADIITTKLVILSCQQLSILKPTALRSLCNKRVEGEHGNVHYFLKSLPE